MLARIATEGGLVYYVSPLLQQIRIKHAFSTRLGGISSGAFTALNLGNPPAGEQDDWNHIHQNYQILQQAIGCESQERCWVHQVHGDVIATAALGQTWESGAKADAIITNDPGRLAVVRVADCVPILLATTDGQWVAAIHAGWRGAAAGILPKTLATLRRAAGIDAEVFAAIGPCISFDAFEVSTDVLDVFRAEFGNNSLLNRQTSADKGFINLQAVLAHQLMESGVAEHQIDTTDRCTFRDADEFYSHRRDKGKTGRMAAMIAPNLKS